LQPSPIDIGVAELIGRIGERGCINRLGDLQSRMATQKFGRGTIKNYAKYFLVISINFMILLTKITLDGWDRTGT
jgi:hypothetical protein